MKKYDKVIGKQFGIIKGERNFVLLKQVEEEILKVLKINI